MVCTVPGPAKAQAIKSMLEGEVAQACPASILRTHRSAYLFIDTDAASLLKAR
jgi:glucosamine-6-phosphate deaminase